MFIVPASLVIDRSIFFMSILQSALLAVQKLGWGMAIVTLHVHSLRPASMTLVTATMMAPILAQDLAQDLVQSLLRDQVSDPRIFLVSAEQILETYGIICRVIPLLTAITIMTWNWHLHLSLTP